MVEKTMDKIVALAKSRGFVYPGSEIYGGLANTWDYDGLVYGVPSTGNAQGVVYNKRVFTEAGVTETPKTPDEFIAALQAIKDYDSSIIPLYTNYADGWPMEQWDGQIAGTTTGDSTYMNQKLLHTKRWHTSICTVQGALRCSGRRTDRG